MTETPEFDVVLRGYHRGQVDAFLERIDVVRRSSDAVTKAEMRARLLKPAHPQGRFDTAFRGYRRETVDAHLKRLAAELT